MGSGSSDLNLLHPVFHPIYDHTPVLPHQEHGDPMTGLTFAVPGDGLPAGRPGR